MYGGIMLAKVAINLTTPNIKLTVNNVIDKIVK
jgi:hypothetical protein